MGTVDLDLATLVAEMRALGVRVLQHGTLRVELGPEPAASEDEPEHIDAEAAELEAQRRADAVLFRSAL